MPISSERGAAQPIQGVENTEQASLPRSSKLGLWRFLIIAATAAAVEIPFLHFGFPSGHDMEFHLYTWLDVLGQWNQGILYPRWAALAHFAYGEPRFIFYPPASWTLGGLLSAILPWPAVSCVYIWLVLTAAGTSMFLLARRWLAARDALFAACVYAANPYIVLIVYWRSAFAELLASCLIPLLMLFVLRAAGASAAQNMREHWRKVVPLALVLSAAWLTNEPAAMMIHYSFALLILLCAWRLRQPSLLVVGAVAVVLGACLAAFYLVPAVYEQKWVNIAEAVSPGSRPEDNFLYAHTAVADHDRFNHLVSWIAAAESLITLAALAAATEWRKKRHSFWFLLAGWAAGMSFLMISPSRFLWEHLPKLQFMQFPWRWLLCLSFVFSLAITVALRPLWARLVLYTVMLAVIVIGWNRLQAPWWDNSDDLREMQDNMVSGAGYEGTDEYTPLGGAVPAVVDQEARKVTVDGPARAVIDVLLWNAESKYFMCTMSEPGNVALRLLNYPAWRVLVNGKQVQTGVKERSGQMLVPLEAGMNHVSITFVRTWDRKLGGWISVIAALVLLAWIIYARSPRRV